MHRIHVNNMLFNVSLLARIRLQYGVQAAEDPDATYSLDPVSRQGLIDQFQNIRNNLGDLGFPIAAMSVGKLVDIFRQSSPRLQDMAKTAEEIETRLIDEASQIIFLSILPEHKGYWLNPNVLGDGIAVAFPSAQEDLEEAAKCLSLDRGTACVFHLMRAMEIGLRVLLNDMGEPYDPKIHTDWSKILAKCNQRVNQPGPKQSFYRDAITTLTSVKWSWRNPTMHPKNLYTVEEATEIWNGVRAFMRHLATQLREEVT